MTQLEGRRYLCRGSGGLVEEAMNPSGSFDTCVRKRRSISCNPKQAQKERKMGKHEIQHMEKLTHPHILRIIGAYKDGYGTTRPPYFLLISLVGDDDLESFLTAVHPGSNIRRCLNHFSTEGGYGTGLIAYNQFWHICMVNVSITMILNRELSFTVTNRPSSQI
ncbi:hypothetical protein K432DRAFT_195573 [Lepidopterella palustris CBS 459.81]|uniref:Protein kinase domain-containing protein n=1 Tax=Lepidopterella palustris CBS 459.81 TaxID=1314670 RepID=A0A8E2EFJ8_9PEZI|nr:hypothetical protein K432DRAFT_195573 [Lepidopterella palustris CBS 459.81]